MFQIKRTVELANDWSNLQDDVKRVLVAMLPSWSAIPPEDIQVDKMSGGITNVLVKLTPPARLCMTPVALRVFGDKTEVLIDRQQELEELLQLNAAGFGAPVLGTFSNGRVERFIPFRPLEAKQMGDKHIAAAIARRLAQLHAVHMTSVKATPQVFVRIYAWLRDARQLRMPTADQQRRFEAVDLEALEREVREVEAACAAAASPLVCSHNDLLAGNIMVPLDADTSGGVVGLPVDNVQFIDFEYSCPMQRGFDWGNHFNEYAGFECDYDHYPNAERAAHFLWHYLEEARGSPPHEEEVAAAVAEANLFALASHQFWGAWAFFQAAYSAIDFDYLAYADLRWAEYQRRKAEFLAPFTRVSRW